MPDLIDETDRYFGGTLGDLLWHRTSTASKKPMTNSGSRSLHRRAYRRRRRQREGNPVADCAHGAVL
jgi:hypothetical protein